MNRYKKIEELFLKTKANLAHLALLMGSNAEYINEYYFEERVQMGADLLPYLDRINKARFMRMFILVLAEYNTYKKSIKSVKNQ